MAKRESLADREKDKTKNGFSMHVLHERPLPMQVVWDRLIP
jgi:hypothetical protein